MAKAKVDPLFSSYRGEPRIRPASRNVSVFVEHKPDPEAGAAFLQLGRALSGLEPGLSAFFARQAKEKRDKNLALGERLEKEEGKTRTWAQFVAANPQYATLSPEAIEGFTRSYLRSLGDLYKDELYTAMPSHTIQDENGREYTLAEIQNNPVLTARWFDSIRARTLGDLSAIDDRLIQEELFPTMEAIEAKLTEVMAIQQREGFLTTFKNQVTQNMVRVFYDAYEDGSLDGIDIDPQVRARLAQQLTTHLNSLIGAGISKEAANNTLVQAVIDIANTVEDATVLDVLKVVETVPGSYVGNIPEYMNLIEAARDTIAERSYQRDLREFNHDQLKKKIAFYDFMIEIFKKNPLATNFSPSVMRHVLETFGPNFFNDFVNTMQNNQSKIVQDMTASMTRRRYEDDILSRTLNENGLTALQQAFVDLTDIGAGRKSPNEINLGKVMHLFTPEQAMSAVHIIREASENRFTLSSRVLDAIKTNIYTPHVVGLMEDSDSAVVLANQADSDLRATLFNAIQKNPDISEEELINVIRSEAASWRTQLEALSAELEAQLGAGIDYPTAAEQTKAVVEEQFNRMETLGNAIEGNLTESFDPAATNLFKENPPFIRYAYNQLVQAKQAGADGWDTLLGKAALKLGMTQDELLQSQVALNKDALPPDVVDRVLYDDAPYLAAVSQVIRLMGEGWTQDLGATAAGLIQELVTNKQLRSEIAEALPDLIEFLQTGGRRGSGYMAFGDWEEALAKPFLMNEEQRNRYIMNILSHFFNIPKKAEEKRIQQWQKKKN